MAQNFSGKREIYLEVAERYERFIHLGVLRGGEKLPSVRQVAEELRVNPNTVQRAYVHLEEKGLIYSLPKKGVFVKESEEGKTPSDVHYGILKAALRAAKEEGISLSEALNAIKEVYEND